MAEQKFTPRAENVLRLAQETALELGHGYVGCEHILLGLLREDGSAACRGRPAMSPVPGYSARSSNIVKSGGSAL